MCLGHLNSNIEIHKFKSIFSSSVPVGNLNSNIEIHKFNLNTHTHSGIQPFKF